MNCEKTTASSESNACCLQADPKPLRDLLRALKRFKSFRGTEAETTTLLSADDKLQFDNGFSCRTLVIYGGLFDLSTRLVITTEPYSDYLARASPAILLKLV